MDDISPRLRELVGRPLEEMPFDEIAELWGEITTQARRLGILSLEPLDTHIASPFVQEALGLALMGTEPDLVQDILETRSRSALLPRVQMRSGMVIEAVMAIESIDRPRIVHHKLGAFYQAEGIELKGELKKVSTEELVARLRQTPFAQLEFAQINALLTDMAGLRRREGLAALKPLVEAADYALLHRGLEMLCDEVQAAQIISALQEVQQEELAQAEARHTMVIKGILATQAGDNPDYVVRMLRDIRGTPASSRPSHTT